MRFPELCPTLCNRGTPPPAQHTTMLHEVSYNANGGGASKQLTFVKLLEVGGAEGIRTPDLYNANVALSQLSYNPMVFVPILDNYKATQPVQSTWNGFKSCGRSSLTARAASWIPLLGAKVVPPSLQSANLSHS